MNNQTQRGGARVGAGRKKMTAEQREAQRLGFEQILIDELIFPAVCAAFHADPGRWQERILTFELSASQIRDAYGRAGLDEWSSYFTPIRRGGCDRFGAGYKALWRFNTGKYGFLLKLVRELGHDIKDLPNPGFPPTAMLKRLETFEAKRAARAAENAKSNSHSAHLTPMRRPPSCDASIGCIRCSSGLGLRDWKSPNTQSTKNRSPDEQS